jgi:type IV secretory pathway VirB10-like protein
MAGPSVVLDCAPKPPGLLPRHAHTWVMLGLAVVMMTIIALSGPSRPAEKRPTSATTSALEPNQARIQEYRARIDEEARRLAAAQAEWEVAKRSVGTQTPPAPLTPAAGESQVAAGPHAAGSEETSMAREHAQREYRALFADNVALTFRPHDEPASHPPTNAPASSPVSTPVPPPADPATATHPRHPLLEGTIIEAVLTNRLDGSFVGPVNALVTTAVYSHDRQHQLIPQGARLLGEAKAVASFGQSRLAVAFHRLVLPDGSAVTLDEFKGLSQVGDTGLRDQVNHHYAELFGVSLAIGAIGGLAQLNARAGVDATAADTYRQGVAISTAQSSLHILDRFLNVLPTVTIREGQRLKVYLSGDLELPAYGER